MKDNYRKALLKAQTQLGDTSSGQFINMGSGPTNRVTTPQTRERSWLGSVGTKIGNWFRPDHRDLDTDVTMIDPNTRKNIKTYQFNDNWGNQPQTIPTQSIPDYDIDPSSGGMINPHEKTHVPSVEPIFPGSKIYEPDPTKPIWPGDRGQIGKETYMQALKAYRKGGQKK